MKGRITRAWAVLRGELDAQMSTLIVALLLIAAGLWTAWRPGAFIVPGVVLLWVVLPTRRRFVETSTLAPPEPRRKRA